MLRNDEITGLKTTQAEDGSTINQQREELDSLRRDAAIAGRRMKENDLKTQ